MTSRSYIIKLVFTLIFFVLFLPYAGAKQNLSYDSSSITLRKPPAEKQKELFSTTDFVYDRKPEGESLWDKIQEWFWRNFNGLFDSDNTSWTLLFIRWGIVLAAVVIVVLLLVKADVRNIFYGKIASTIEFSEISEDINKIDFDKLIDEALKKKNFRKAVRLHFLKLLKHLSDKNLIDWRADKTNSDYYSELMKNNYHDDFREVSIYYEYIWYGDFRVNEEVFRKASEQFSFFNSRLNKHV